ncbi:MAG: Na+/H+ antiporter NhaA, partial [Deltaproteobacteria bacterium]|nr:Na+/H+ antiporter NhaA [Deltaproteobacteria bacterium]
EIVWGFIGLGMAFWAVLILCNRLGVRHPLIYALFGTLLWVSFLKSGVHATIAGVMAAMTIPVRTRINAEEFLECGRAYLSEFDRAGERGTTILTNAEQHGSLQALETACHVAEPPLQRFEHTLHPWVSFGVMPIFALANAGVFLGGDIRAVLVNPVTLGVGFGLVLGKQIGIMLFAWAVVRMGLADFPKGVSWRQIYGASWLAGIGFTMSLFIGGLAFGQNPLLDAAKVGVLLASSVSAVIGWSILVRSTSP